MHYARAVFLLGTKIHDSVMRTLKPTATPIVPAVPICPRMARPVNAPRKSAPAAMRRWSRVMTRWRIVNRRGSDMSSTQTVVSTTVARRRQQLARYGIKLWHALVVPNCVLRRFPRIPCTPRAALMNARPTKVRRFVQAGSSRSSAMLPWPDFQKEMAAAMVKSAWMNVPAISHNLLCAPTLSPMRPMNAPRLKEMSEHSAC